MKHFDHTEYTEILITAQQLSIIICVDRKQL